jgi:hypothetical protein
MIPALVSWVGSLLGVTDPSALLTAQSIVLAGLVLGAVYFGAALLLGMALGALRSSMRG